MSTGLTRRNFLKGLGAALVVVSGGVGVRAIDNGVLSVGQGAAYAPWTHWREPQAGPLNLVRAAILAANPHNSQPWLFRVSEQQIDLFADTRRQIGTIDPFLREMHTGLGCALTNLLLAARAEGYAPTLTLMPDPANAAHIATVTLSAAAPETSPLYEAIARRHTDRGAYDTARSMSSDHLAKLSALATDDLNVKLLWLTQPDRLQLFRDQTLAATQAIIDDAQQSHDSFVWMRQSWHELQDQRDGITFDAQGMAGVISAAAKIVPPLTIEQNDAGWYQALAERQLPTAAAVGLILVHDGLDPVQRLRGGMLWQRLHLQLTLDGVSAQPLNQLPERKDREIQLGIEPRFGQALAELVGDDQWTCLMPFRVGYPTAAALPSPRRGYDEVIG